MAIPSPDRAGDELGPLGALAGYHLRRACAVFAADFHRALADTGIRQVLFGILSVVGSSPGINQGAVGRRLGIQRANMVSLINELVERGLIERRTADDDRRAFALTLSRSGKAMHQRCLTRIHAHEEEMLAGLAPGDRKSLLELLSRIEAREPVLADPLAIEGDRALGG